MSAEVADLLDRAADRIEPEGAWTQGTYGRRADGNAIGPDEPDATCWCPLGALSAEVPGGSWPLAVRALRAAAGIPDGLGVGDWNDHRERTQAEVVAALREAARRERES